MHNRKWVFCMQIHFHFLTPETPQLKCSTYCLERSRRCQNVYLYWQTLGIKTWKFGNPKIGKVSKFLRIKVYSGICTYFIPMRKVVNPKTQHELVRKVVTPKDLWLNPVEKESMWNMLGLSLNQAFFCLIGFDQTLPDMLSSISDCDCNIVNMLS